jgi:hypothetical protein
VGNLWKSPVFRYFIIIECQHCQCFLIFIILISGHKYKRNLIVKNKLKHHEFVKWVHFECKQCNTYVTKGVHNNNTQNYVAAPSVIKLWCRNVLQPTVCTHQVHIVEFQQRSLIITYVRTLYLHNPNERVLSFTKRLLGRTWW